MFHCVWQGLVASQERFQSAERLGGSIVTTAIGSARGMSELLARKKQKQLYIWVVLAGGFEHVFSMSLWNDDPQMTWLDGEIIQIISYWNALSTHVSIKSTVFGVWILGPVPNCEFDTRCVAPAMWMFMSSPTDWWCSADPRVFLRVKVHCGWISCRFGVVRKTKGFLEFLRHAKQYESNGFQMGNWQMNHSKSWDGEWRAREWKVRIGIWLVSLVK